MFWTWMALAAAVLLTAGCCGLMFAAVGRRIERLSGEEAAPGPVSEAEDDAAAVRAAAERAVAAADEARHRVESVTGERDRAEERYLAAQRDALGEAQTSATEEPHLLVQRAALDAYRRGQLSAARLNDIWQHAGTTPGEPDGTRVRAARQVYQQAVAQTAQVRREAHVAAVAAEVLAEETRIVERDLVAAQQSVRHGLDGLLDSPGN